jgi:hypothetical protein
MSNSTVSSIEQRTLFETPRLVFVHWSVQGDLLIQ